MTYELIASETVPLSLYNNLDQSDTDDVSVVKLVSLVGDAYVSDIQVKICTAPPGTIKKLFHL